MSFHSSAVNFITKTPAPPPRKTIRTYVDVQKWRSDTTTRTRQTDRAYGKVRSCWRDELAICDCVASLWRNEIWTYKGTQGLFCRLADGCVGREVIVLQDFGACFFGLDKATSLSMEPRRPGHDVPSLVVGKRPRRLCRIRLRFEESGSNSRAHGSRPQPRRTRPWFGCGRD